MEAITPILTIIEKWGITGVLVGIIVALGWGVRKLDDRNQSLVDRHLEDKAKQIEAMAEHKSILEKILYIIERLSGRADK